MSRTFQITSNGRCLLRALAHLQWRKLPHFNRGLCRAFLGNDPIGGALANLWPIGTLVGVVTVLMTS